MQILHRILLFIAHTQTKQFILNFQIISMYIILVISSIQKLILIYTYRWLNTLLTGSCYFFLRYRFFHNEKMSSESFFN